MFTVPVLRGMSCFAMFVGLVAPAVAQQATADHLQSPRPLVQVVSASSRLSPKLAAQSRTGLSLATGDFYNDGTASLVTGYATPGGGLLALQHGAATSATQPFADAASLTDPGLRPDLLRAADLNGDGNLDLVAATRGKSGLSLLLGDGRGNFNVLAIATTAPVLSLALWHDPTTGAAYPVAGLCGNTCTLAVYNVTGSVLASVAVPDRPELLAVARLQGSPAEDLVAGSASGLSLVDGETLLGGSPQLSRLPIANAAALATGVFLYDRRGYPQIAVLTTDGSIRILARTGVDATFPAPSGIQQSRRARLTTHSTPPAYATLGWTIAESLDSVAPPTGAAAPLLLRSNLSGSGQDDLVALNTNGGRITSIAHPVVTAAAGESPTALAARVDVESAASDAVQAAVPMRLSADARLGLVTVDGQAHAAVTLPATAHTYNVNTTSDAAVTTTTKAACTGNAANCNLRSAFALVATDAAANESAGTIDTVNVIAGTYTLSYTAGLDSQGSLTYHIEIAGPVNLVGAGSATTILTAANNDKIFSINSGVVNTQTGFSTFMSGLTIENGTNKNSYISQPSSNTYGGLIDAEILGSGNLTLTNCILTAGTVQYGPGGGLFVSNSGSTATGVVDLESTTVSASKTPETGGGLDLGDSVPFILNASTISGNSAKPSNNTLDSGALGQGGGLYAGEMTRGAQGTITASVISGNSSTSYGGGVFATDGLVVSGSSITGNSSASYGGGFYIDGITYTSTYSQLTVTGNTATTDGAGIAIGGTTKAVSVTYSRIALNTGGTHTGIANGLGSGGVTLTATDNFWGCNGAATGTGCNTAGNNGGSATVTVSPYAVSNAVLSSTIIPVGTTVTIYGELANDSAGMSFSAANLVAFAAATATDNISVGGSSIGSSTGLLTGGALNLSATPGSPGSGVATFTVDNAVVTLPFTVYPVVAPTIAIAFSPTSVLLNGSSTLTYTLTNQNAAFPVSGVAFSNTLPAGLVLSASTGLFNSCSGTVTAVAGGSSVALSGGGMDAGAHCTITVSVTVTTAGSKSDTTGVITTTTPASTGTVSNTAVLSVTAAPTLALSYGASQVLLNGTTTLTYAVTNPNASTSVSGIAFSDSLPANLTVSTPNGLSGACGGGTIAATAGGSTVSLSGATLAGGASCSFSVNVTGVSLGSATNTSGAISSTTPALTGSTASATLQVYATVGTALAFGASSVVVGGTTSLTATLSNPTGNPISYTALAFTNTLPAGLIVSSTAASGTNCTGTVTATAGSGTIGYSGGTLAAGSSCLVVVNVTPNTASTFTDTFASSSSVGTGSTGTATLSSTQITPTVTLNTPPAQLNRGVSTTLTATFGTIASGPAPTAQVSFYDGTTLLGSATATLVGSGTYTASINTAAIPSGTQSLTAKYPGDAAYLTVTSAPQSVFVVANDLWIANSNATVSALHYDGSALIASPESSGGTAVAIDSTGAVWSLNSTGVAKYTAAGTVVGANYTGAGVSSPTSLAIDGAGQVWVANGTNTVSVYASTGAPVSATPYGVSTNAPSSVSVDQAGNLWITNSGNDSVTEVIGVAAPTTTPFAAAIAKDTLGTKP